MPGTKVPSTEVADIRGFMMRVASLSDPLRGKILAWQDSERRASKWQKDWFEIMWLIMAHPKVREFASAANLFRQRDKIALQSGHFFVRFELRVDLVKIGADAEQNPARRYWREMAFLQTVIGVQQIFYAIGF